MFCLRFAVFFFLVSIRCRVMACLESTWRKYRDQAKISDNSLIQLKLHQRINCILECNNMTNCVTFAFDPVTNNCNLYDFMPLNFNPNTYIDHKVKYHTRKKDKCPNSYTYLSAENRCIKVYSTEKKFDAALAVCMADGGILPMIEDQTFRLAIKTHFSLGTKYHFIGGNNRIDTNSNRTIFRWLNGAEVGMWAPGEPDGDGEKCNTISAGHDYFIRDVNCITPYPFLCEIYV